QSPGLKMLNQRNKELHVSTPQNKGCYYSKSKFIDTSGMHPYDIITNVRRLIGANSNNHFLIIDVNQKYFCTNLMPQLVRLASSFNLPIIITSEVPTDDPNENMSLPLQTVFYLH